MLRRPVRPDCRLKTVGVRLRTVGVGLKTVGVPIWSAPLKSKEEAAPRRPLRACGRAPYCGSRGRGSEAAPTDHARIDRVNPKTTGGPPEMNDARNNRGDHGCL